MSSSEIIKALKWAKQNYDGKMEQGILRDEVMYEFSGLNTEDAGTVARAVVNDYHDYTYNNDPYGFRDGSW